MAALSLLRVPGETGCTEAINGSLWNRSWRRCGRWSSRLRLNPPRSSARIGMAVPDNRSPAGWIIQPVRLNRPAFQPRLSRPFRPRGGSACLPRASACGLSPGLGSAGPLGRVGQRLQAGSGLDYQILALLAPGERFVSRWTGLPALLEEHRDIHPPDQVPGAWTGSPHSMEK